MSGMNDHDVIDRLRELAEATAGTQPSAGVEARVLRAFAETRRPPAARWRRSRRWVLTAAAAALVATTTVLVWRTANSRPGHSVPPPDTSAESPAASLEGFVPVPGAGLLPHLESARIVRYALPVAALPAYGVDVVPDAIRRDVLADLLIGQDGHARAIRLVADTALIRSTP